MKQLTLGFVGLGLIGGSVAKALRLARPDSKIIAYDINADSLSQAAAEKVADITVTVLDSSFGECDYIFFCAPITENDSNLLALKQVIAPSCIITDVGSVKGDIHAHIAALGLNGQFIGGHPMAGSERFGYINSKAKLLENAYYIITPTDSVPSEKVEAYKQLVASMGAIPLILSAKQHDYITAAVSHLPHIIAASLVNLIKDSDTADGIMKMVAAGGFKDITRIASSSPGMWQQICLSNMDNIKILLDNYISSLLHIREEICDGAEQAVYDFFDNARIYRDSFIEASSGPIKKSYSITIDIADETGVLASIAAILALNHISIKNIGIVHNREFEEGALRIEFYEETDIVTAGEILTGRGYNIHTKK